MEYMEKSAELCKRAGVCDDCKHTAAGLIEGTSRLAYRYGRRDFMFEAVIAGSIALVITLIYKWVTHV